MSLEDAAVLGEVLSRIRCKSTTSKRLALGVYEACRAPRTRMVVERGNMQQYLYHLHDGLEQEERDRKMRMVPTPPGEALAWRDPELSVRLLGYDFVADVERHWSKEEGAVQAKL
jgi:salicylate hydroxylase